MSYKIGRNELCKCGSGLKYKKCCLNTTTDKFISLESKIREDIGQEITIIHNPKNQVKMSGLILNLIDEYYKEVRTLERAQSLVCMGCMAWNLSLLDDEDVRQRAIVEGARKVFSVLDEQANITFVAIMNDLIKKKQLKYPEHKRYITNFEVTEANNQFNVQIASTIPD